MNVLFVNKFYHPRIGGVETTVKEVAEGLSRSGNRSTVLALDAGEAKTEELGDVRVVRIRTRPSLADGPSLGAWRYLSRELRPDRFQVVNIHSYHTFLSFQTALFCKLRGVPYVFSAHYHGQGHTAVRDLLFRAYHLIGGLALSGADTIISVSKYEKGALIKDFPGLRREIVVVPSGIKEYPPVEVERKDDTFLYVGRIMGYKGIDHLLRAISRLKARGSLMKLRVVGTGPEQAGLTALSRELGVEELVTWLGDITEESLNREYRGATALVLLSAAEAYGLVVAEALSCGTPVVVAKKEALVEWLEEPGCFGVDFPPDPEKVADLLLDLSKRSGRIKVGPFSEKVVLWPKVAESYLQVFERAQAR